MDPTGDFPFQDSDPPPLPKFKTPAETVSVSRAAATTSVEMSRCGAVEDRWHRRDVHTTRRAHVPNENSFTSPPVTSSPVTSPPMSFLSFASLLPNPFHSPRWTLRTAIGTCRVCESDRVKSWILTKVGVVSDFLRMWLGLEVRGLHCDLN